MSFSWSEAPAHSCVTFFMFTDHEQHTKEPTYPSRPAPRFTLLPWRVETLRGHGQSGSGGLSSSRTP